MGPKKNNQKMSIGDFLSDQSLGSWADEMDGQPMPAPSSGFGGERRTFGSAGGFGSGGDRGGDRYASRGGGGGFDDARPNRENLPLPTRPPYTAHLGNLSFEVTESDVQGVLSGCDVTSVRIVEDKMDRKPKGFGYVEFGTLDGLKKALTLSETQFQGRNVRISVAEPPKDRGESREISDWTRKGPLPDLPGQGVRRDSERSSGGGFRSGMGSGMDPALDENNGGGYRRGPAPESDGKQRDFSNWERKGPLTPSLGQEPRQGGRGSQDFGGARERRPSPSWGEGRSDAGSRPPRREFSERPPPADRTPTAAESDTQWRTKMRPDAPEPTASATTPETSVPSSPAQPPKPFERQRLNLQKRTVSETPKDDEAAPASSDAKASPFGAARPIDTSTREREIEEKRQLAIRQKKEADDKARDEKRAREQAAKEKAAADSPADSAQATPKVNGAAKSDNSAKDQAAPKQILQRGTGDEESEHDVPDEDAQGEIIGDKETKPQELVREVPIGQGSDAQAPETSAEQLESDGFTVVAGKQKKGRSGQRALAS